LYGAKQISVFPAFIQISARLRLKSLPYIFSYSVEKENEEEREKKEVVSLIKAAVGSTVSTKILLNVPVSFICLKSLQ